MPTIKFTGVSAEQVQAFADWFNQRGEEDFRDFCRDTGINPEPYVDGETAPGYKRPDYDGSLNINCYSLPADHYERVRLQRAVRAAYKKDA